MSTYSLKSIAQSALTGIALIGFFIICIYNFETLRFDQLGIAAGLMCLYMATGLVASFSDNINVSK